MRTGRPAWMDDEYRYLGLVVKTLRDNSDAFLSHDWAPLLPAAVDSVWVNHVARAVTRPSTRCTELRPEGFTGPLFEAPVAPGEALREPLAPHGARPGERGREDLGAGRPSTGSAGRGSAPGGKPMSIVSPGSRIS